MIYKPLAVYGTLRQGHGNYMRLIQGAHDMTAPARVYGYTLYAQGIPYAVRCGCRPPWATEPCRRHSVVVDLFWIKLGWYPWTLSAVDRLEGYDEGGDVTFYGRVGVEAEMAFTDGSTIRVGAWMYEAAPAIARRLKRERALVPSGDYEDYERDEWVRYVTDTEAEEESNDDFVSAGQQGDRGAVDGGAATGAVSGLAPV